MSTNRGFTLIELIVVISLIGLLAGISAPRFQAAMTSDGIRRTSAKIMGTVAHLKNRAVKERTNYNLIFDVSGNRIWIEEEKPPGKKSSTQDETKEEDVSADAYELSDGISITDIEFADDNIVTSGRAKIHFNREGWSSMAAIHIAADDDEHMTFIIEPFLDRVEVFKSYQSLDQEGE